MASPTPPSPPNASLGTFFAAAAQDDLSSHLHRQLIGYLGFALPPLLWLISGLRPTDPLEPWDLLDSISSYYYTGAVAAFVGILVALAAFFITYQGYDNEHRRRDRIAAIIAAVAAIGVAFFPTGAPAGVLPASWWTPETRTIHYGSAVTLFGTFIFYALFLFPKSRIKAGETLPPDKQARNFLYRSCGWIMLACMAWAGSALFTNAAIFWPEAIALWVFAFSWLVKGRADWTLRAAGRRALHYIRGSS